MHIGLVGLGKMGNNMRTQLRRHDIEVTGYDRNPEQTDVAGLAQLAAALPAPRIVWRRHVLGAGRDLAQQVPEQLGHFPSSGVGPGVPAGQAPLRAYDSVH